MQAMQMQLPPVMTPEEFGRAFGLGRSRVYAEIKAGRLRATKIGHNTRVALVDGFEWLEARRAETRRQGPGIDQAA